MLFSRVYNWIKYKTLPPSVLFSNRLFVERDSKHRRVTSNLGLTFRNSKWSSYARINVNTTSRSNYFNLLFRLFFIICVLYVITHISALYDRNLLSTGLYTLVWFLFDADIYAKAIFSSSVVCILQMIMSSIQTRLLSMFSDTTEKTSDLKFVYPQPHLPKYLHKPILYSWLAQSSDIKHISNLVGDSSNSLHSQNVCNLVSALYSSIRLIRRSNDSSLELSRILKAVENCESSPVRTYLSLNLTHSTSQLQYLTSSLDYLLKYTSSETNSSYFSECSNWALAELQTELVRYPDTQSSVSGLFYLPELSYAQLNSININLRELDIFRTSVENQLSIIRWQRWLYKYNVLHRSILRNTQYLTSTKKLLNSGFYSSSLTTRNLWAASNFNNQEVDSNKSNAVSGSYSTIYGNYTGSANGSTTFLRPSNLLYNNSTASSLGYYELSYHWFVQRFYQFNTLYSNQAISSATLSNTAESTIANSAKALEHVSVLFDTDLTTALTQDTVSGPRSSTLVCIPGSVYLNYVDRNLFSKPRTEQMINITKTRVSSTIPFYSPTEIQSLSLPVYK